MTEMRDVRHGLSLCAYELRKATEAAARVSAARVSAGPLAGGNDAALAALLAELDAQGLDAKLLDGSARRLGDPKRLPVWDVLADPCEGAACLTQGSTNAMACLAVTPAGSLFDPGPAFYMEKLVAPPQAAGHLDPTAPVEDRLSILARCLGKSVAELTIFILEKPRHRDLIERIEACGAQALQYPAGDVAGAVLAAMPDSGIDALMGTGGIAEGLLAACAARVMGGCFLARLDPQLTTERRAVSEAGLNTHQWMDLDHLVKADEIAFCATGIASGLLLDGVERQGGAWKTQTLMVGGGAGMRQMLTSWHVDGGTR
ncbi:MAG: fructose-bisphosphatase class II [Magnetospirillum sp.]